MLLPLLHADALDITLDIELWRESPLFEMSVSEELVALFC